ncbi:MAG TPA: SDR family NAD(P)-dependent oxidoreductase [Micromonosporaceae bacterium]|nr:SDR family NAD(P)-dependent oxidoreductase [Micromonosporaceae bacterium]
MAGPLAGKVALVTGASSGIGRATARALAGQGADVAIGARRTDRLKELHEEIVALGVRALAVELDVNDEASCRRSVDQTVAELGGLDILINNAGVMLLGQIEGADTEDWRRMMATNVLGLMYMTHAGLPHLLDRRGVVVQMSSTAGRFARSGAGGYNASKWAVNAFSEALRQEVTTRGVRVVVVEPGVVETELRDHITQPAAKEQIDAMANAMRQLQPEDVAAAVVYAVTQPPHVAVNEVLIRPTDQER